MAHRSVLLTLLCSVLAVVVGFAAQAGQGAGQRGAAPPQGTPPAGARGQGGGRGGGRGGPITLHAARVIDGKGHMTENAVVTVQGSRIVSVGPAKAGDTFTYDFGDATILPGFIDVHVHLNWYFGPNGHYGERGLPPDYEGEAVQANARATLMGGFTTVQSVGWAKDKELREAIAAGLIAGPRLLSSLDQIVPRPTDTPEQLRERVRRDKADGADLIKLFASASIRDGGKMNITQEQADAVCSEAKAQGLRSLVHAHSSDSIIAAVKAGCTEIEHGLFADDEAIAVMKQANVYFDPNIGLVLQNYLENEFKFMGSDNFNAEGFAAMKAALPNLPVVFKKALAAGLRMPLGTDAVAGAFGQNAREIVARVNAGQPAMDALTGATSLSAESIGLGTTIGTIAPGFQADLVVVPQNPLTDISVVRYVSFVMKGGAVFKK